MYYNHFESGQETKSTKHLRLVYGTSLFDIEPSSGQMKIRG